MYRANNINETEAIETACSPAIEVEPVEKDDLPGHPCKRDGTFQLTSAAEGGGNGSRKPGKRNGCIGKWLHRVTEAGRETTGGEIPDCHCGGH